MSVQSITPDTVRAKFEEIYALLAALEERLALLGVRVSKLEKPSKRTRK
jgi:hypothetical protein